MCQAGITIKKQVHDLLFTSDSARARTAQVLIVLLILLNALAVMLETVEPFATVYAGPLALFELVCVLLFTVEYALRLYSCNYAEQKRLSWILSPLAVVDLLAIAPFYLPFLIPFDLRFLRILRLFRVLRILKLARQSEALRLLGSVLKRTADQLAVTLFCLSILLVISATIMYHAEHSAQPDVFSSIPASLWWGVATLTTVGYGDMYPITPVGKVCSSFVTILAVGLFALPTAIISSAFIEVVQTSRKVEPGEECPVCGRSE